jgi:hypothetical protein
MPNPIDRTVNSLPVVLTPPMGTRRVSNGHGSSRRRGKKNGLRDILRVEPTPWHLLVAAALYWATPALLSRLQKVFLPHDMLFSGVVYLMWSGSHTASEIMATAFDMLMALELAAAALLVASALLPRERMFAPAHAVARRLYRYAVAISLWTIVVGGLARFIADQIYALGNVVSWDLTPIFARIEGPVIERLQHAVASPSMSVFASNFYSAIWLTPLILAGFALAAADKPRALCALLVAYLVTAVSAMPLFVVLPAFDPWTTNALYGAIGKTSIQFLYSSPSIPALSEINARYHWSAGAAFPSLHVAFPLVTALVLRKHRLRWTSWFMVAMAATSMFVVVYLGRNWIVSTLFAIPFAFAIVAVAERIPFNVVLKPRRKPQQVLRPGEIAVPIDPNVRAVEWYSAMFFLCAFAGVLSQISWQRTLFNILGVGTPTAAVVSTSVMVGLGVGFYVGIWISRRPVMPLAAFLSAAQIAVGLFCFGSMPLFQLIGRMTSEWGFALPASLAFFALLPPTIPTGAMVPLLVTDQVRRRQSVGDAVGRLVFMGGLGAAAAAAFAALILLGPLGLTATVQVAGVLNVGIGVLVYSREHPLVRKR